jgi:hypothetical protein
MEKVMEIKRYIKKADKIISEQGLCLLLFDVMESKNFKNSYKLQEKLKYMCQDFNQKFKTYFPKNNLGALKREERGFQSLLGDSSWAGINSSAVIPDIIKYQNEKYPNIPLYWGIAKDGYDEGGIKIAK